MKTLQTIILTVLTTMVFSQDCNTFFTGSFAPTEQSTQDSVYYLITLPSIYELHTTKEYRNIFDLNWYDHCTFEMGFDNSSIKSDSEYEKDESFMCSIAFVNDSVFELTMNEKTIRLKRHDGQAIWYMMMHRDNELKNIEKERKKTLEEYEAMLEKGDSLSGMLGMINAFKKPLEDGLDLNDFELDAIGKLFDNLKTFDSESFYSSSSTELKKEIDQETLSQYFSYIKNAYGRWEYFSVFSQSMNSSLFGLPVTHSGVENFSFKVKFENCINEVTLSLTLSEENNKEELMEGEEHTYMILQGPRTFQSINISSNEYEESDYLSEISSQFFGNFYKKKYSKIYKESSNALQQEASVDQIENMLSLAHSMSDGQQYKLHSHAFTMHQEHGGLIIIHYVSPTDKKDMYLSLTYTGTPGNHQLIGLNIQEK